MKAGGDCVETMHLDSSLLVSCFSSGEECLTLALKGRCQNQLKRRQASPDRIMGNTHSRLGGVALRGGSITTSGGSRLLDRAIGGLCEVHFLPLVIGVGDNNRTQRLRCVGESSIHCLVMYWSRNNPLLLFSPPAECADSGFDQKLEGVKMPSCPSK